MTEAMIIKYAIGAGFALLCLLGLLGISFMVRRKRERAHSIPVHVSQIVFLCSLVLVLQQYALMAIHDFDLHFITPTIVRFLSVLAIALIVTRKLFMLINRLEKNQVRHGHDATSTRILARTLKIVIVVAMLLLFGEHFGISLSGLLAFGGVGGIAIGLASKDILSNAFAGTMLYFDRPFALGDWISSPDRSIEGTVEEIGWRITRITTFDNRPLYVPNALFATIAVANPGRMTNRRISTEIGLRYEDADKVAVIVQDIRQLLRADERIDQTQDLLVYFNAFADSSLNIMVYCFTKTTGWAAWLEIQQSIYLKIIDIVQGHGADFAFPSQTLYMAPGAAEAADNSNPASPPAGPPGPPAGGPAAGPRTSAPAAPPPATR